MSSSNELKGLAQAVYDQFHRLGTPLFTIQHSIVADKEYSYPIYQIIESMKKVHFHFRQLHGAIEKLEEFAHHEISILEEEFKELEESIKKEKDEA